MRMMSSHLGFSLIGHHSKNEHKVLNSRHSLEFISKKTISQYLKVH